MPVAATETAQIDHVRQNAAGARRLTTATLRPDRSGNVTARHRTLGRLPKVRLSTWRDAPACVWIPPWALGIGPVPAMHKVLGLAGWRLDEVGLLEINEASAAHSVAVVSNLERLAANERSLDLARGRVSRRERAAGHWAAGC